MVFDDVGVNVALKKPITAMGTQNPNYKAEYANDGLVANVGSYYQAADADPFYQVTVDLLQKLMLKKVTILFPITTNAYVAKRSQGVHVELLTSNGYVIPYSTIKTTKIEINQTFDFYSLDQTECERSE